MVCVAQIGGAKKKNEMNYGVKIVRALYVFQLVEFVTLRLLLFTNLSFYIYKKYKMKHLVLWSYVYTLRLIGPISYSCECDLMVHLRKYSVIFSRMHFATVIRI